MNGTRPIVPFEAAEFRKAASFFTTILRAARPWSFWKWVGAQRHPRWFRLVAVCVGGAAIVHVIAALPPIVCGWIAEWINPPPQFAQFGIYRLHSSGSARELMLGLWPWGNLSGMTVDEQVPVFRPDAIFNFIAAALCVAFVCLWAHARKQRMSAVIRVAAYGLIWAPVTHGILRLCDGTIMIMEAVETRLRQSDEWCLDVRYFVSSARPVISMAIVLLYMLAWWGFAGGRVLGWRRPWRTAALIAFTSYFLAVCGLLLVPGGAMWVSGYWP